MVIESEFRNADLQFNHISTIVQVWDDTAHLSLPRPSNSSIGPSIAFATSHSFERQKEQLVLG